MCAALHSAQLKRQQTEHSTCTKPGPFFFLLGEMLLLRG